MDSKKYIRYEIKNNLKCKMSKVNVIFLIFDMANQTCIRHHCPHHVR